MYFTTIIASWVESIPTMKWRATGVSNSSIFPLYWKCFEEYKNSSFSHRASNHGGPPDLLLAWKIYLPAVRFGDFLCLKKSTGPGWTYTKHGVCMTREWMVCPQGCFTNWPVCSTSLGLLLACFALAGAVKWHHQELKLLMQNHSLFHQELLRNTFLLFHVEEWDCFESRVIEKLWIDNNELEMCLAIGSLSSHCVWYPLNSQGEN